MAEGLIKEQGVAKDEAAREAVANRRAKMLLSAMTLDQKLQQLTGAKPEVLPELPHCFGARHVSGMPKHYAANEQETNRQTIQTTVDRQTLRELYRPGTAHRLSRPSQALTGPAHRLVLRHKPTKRAGLQPPVQSASFSLSSSLDHQFHIVPSSRRATGR
jgi:hypothetical protein